MLSKFACILGAYTPQFPTKSIPWPTAGVRRASVNAFGYGGANAHVVLDDAESFLSSYEFLRTSQLGEPPGLPQLLVWSTAEEAGIQRLAASLGNHVAGIPESATLEYLQNFAYTLSEKRTRFPWKSFTLVKTANEVGPMLNDNLRKPIRSSMAPNTHFVFTGQGVQWSGMGLELLRYPIFERSIRAAETHFGSLGACWFLTRTSSYSSGSMLHAPS